VQVGLVEPIGLVKGALNDVARLEASELGLKDRAALSCFLDVIIFHDPVRAFERDNNSLFELSGGDHGDWDSYR
jgi:hypothetical protein